MSVTHPIYLDHHATTPVDPRVLEAMLPFFTETFGNPASKSHAWGWAAEEAVEKARAQVAALLGARPEEIVFTAGATESDNLAIQGALPHLRGKGKHLVVTAIEHRAVLDTAKRLERQGLAEVTVLPVTPAGLVDVNQLEQALGPATVLVSVMAANNEVGTIQPLAEIGKLAKARGILFHTDAAQAAGKIPLEVERLGIDLLSLSGHKFYAPKGIGALYVRKKNPRVRLTPLLEGGGQERGLRPGTLAVPSIVGLGEACAIAMIEMDEEAKRLGQLRERLRLRLTGELREVHVNGDLERRLPGNLSVSFADVQGEALITGLKGIAVSSGSACTSKSIEPSHVLKAMGVSDDDAYTTLRFGLGRGTTAGEIDEVAAEVIRLVNRLREISPLWQSRLRRGLAQDVRQEGE